MIKANLERIVIDPEVADTPMAAAIRRNAGGVEITVEPTARFAGAVRHLGLTAGKRLLLVQAFRGRAVKACQGLKPDYACCNLHTLADANNCAMECTYCILQFYMTSPHISVFANTAELQAEITRRVSSDPRRLFRIGTGELSDSLLLDPLTESTRHMVPFFRCLANGVLELKSKTDNVENLLDLDHGEKTVVSWSVNPPAVVAKEELKTASLERRLAAARAVAARGYPVGFHIDPMIHYPSWREGYASLADSILGAVPPERIAWISIGGLRFPPEMKGTMERRFPRSELRYGELLRGEDGKMHYLRPLRVEMYRWVVERLGARLPVPERGPVIYLCMEPPEVWKSVFGERAPSLAELDYRFAASYRNRFRRASLPPPEIADYSTGGKSPASPETSRPFVPLESVRAFSGSRSA